MNNKNAFYATLILSVIVQILTGALEIGTLFIKVDSPYLILRQLLVLEVIVQFIEGLFYVWLVYNFNIFILVFILSIFVLCGVLVLKCYYENLVFFH